MRDCLIEVKQLSTRSNKVGDAKNFNNAFSNCTNLRKVTAYNLTPTNCQNMFNSCSSLTELVGLDTWDMSNCTNVNYMFYGAGITDPTPVYDMLSTYKGNGLSYFFQGSNIESFEFSKMPKTITSYFIVANNCANLKTIDFTGASNNISSLQQAFQACPNVTSIIGLETFTAPDGINLFKIFANGTLRNISILDMSNLTCKVADLPGTGDSASLTTIKWAFDWSNISRVENFIWFNLPNVTNYEFGRNIKADLGSNTSLSTMNKLTVDSLLNLFNALYDFASEGNTDTHTCIIGATNLAKLTDEQIAIATNKGWTVS